MRYINAAALLAFILLHVHHISRLYFDKNFQRKSCKLYFVLTMWLFE